MPRRLLSRLAATFLLAAALGPAALADTAPDLGALKGKAAAGDTAARVELVQALLASVPRTPRADVPSPALFAAQCWWTGLDQSAAIEARTLSEATLAEIEAEFAARETELRLVPSDKSWQKATDEQRWGDGASDRFGTRNRNIRESLPATAAILLQFAQNRKHDEALSRAEALDWARPETHALIAQLHILAGNLPQAEEAAQRTLQLYRGHYSGHSVLAQIEFRRLKGSYVCDTALAWERLVQADMHNDESTLLVTNLIELYQLERDPMRLKALRDRLDNRIRYHELAASWGERMTGISPYRPYLSEAQLAQFRTMRDQADVELAKLKPADKP
ncbi:hypothetical protein [Porphyrobacter sp. HT-58-2]|uniref:hypothetical protein n=1 Tax=Porphyrobacter sp. HT-58-2 TaxID=2023229 RepID=UPI0011B01DE2|nr:hypothetical protein [Porphyrobacter sp. HT-58-2]